MWSCKLWMEAQVMATLLMEVSLNSAYVLQNGQFIGEKKNIHDIVHYEIV